MYLCPTLRMYRSLLHGNKSNLSTDLMLQPRDLYDRLLECIMQNDARKVQDIIYTEDNILKHEAELTKDSDTFPLLLATMLGNAKIVSLLIGAGINPNQILEGPAFSNARSPTCIHQAVEDGNLQIVKILTRCRNINLDAQNSDGESPLHIAVEDGNLDIVHTLLLAGCNVNILDTQGNNPLHIALSSNRCNLAIIKALVAYGVDINAINSVNLTPAKYAAMAGNLPAVGLIISAGCQLQYQKEFLSPLEASILQNDHYSVQALLSAQQVLTNIAKSDMEICMINDNEVVLQTPDTCCINVEDPDCHYVDESVHFAARYGTTNIISVILNYKSSEIDCLNSQGETPLFLSCRYNNIDTLKVLLARNAQVNKCTLYGMSCLCKATLDNNVPVTLNLLMHGSDVNYGLEANSAAIHKALFCGFHQMSVLLIQCNCILNNSALHLVLSSKDWGLMPFIHAAGYHYFARTVAVQMIKHEPHVDADILDWAVMVLSGPESLQHQCRVVLRQAMKGHLYQCVQKLKLPRIMKDYLLIGMESYHESYM